MNDDRMDELIIRAARDYNEPGATPREDLWARIQAERQHETGTAARPLGARKRWAAAGIAAAAVLAVGIVIGRRIERSATPKAHTVAKSAPSVTVPRPAQAITQPRESIVAELRTETRKTDESARRLAENDARNPAAAESDNLAYRLVLLRHLSGSEAMITAFRSSARKGEVDAEIADWSRELLGTTRMLEHSPAAQDPTMKRLLEDLDLVIVQIARYATTGKSNPDDLDLIEQSITKRGVLTKLRSTARAFPAGT
jgi:hypothetical protein